MKQDYRIILAIAKAKAKKAPKLKKGVKAIKPSEVLTKRDFEQNPFLKYKDQ
jgi:hypothetical protein